MQKKTIVALTLCLVFGCSGMLAGQIQDHPFLQAESVKYKMAPELKDAKLIKTVVDYNQIVYLLTSKGLYREFEGNEIAKDLLYRKISDWTPVDVTTQEEEGYLYYLYSDRFLSNAHAGAIFAKFPAGIYNQLVVNKQGTVLLAGPNKVALYINNEKSAEYDIHGAGLNKWYVHKGAFYALSAGSICKLEKNGIRKIFTGDGLNALAFKGDSLYVGTQSGFMILQKESGKILMPLQQRLPVQTITGITIAGKDLWCATDDGAFRQDSDRYRYFEGKRWLDQNKIIDLTADQAGNLYLLTPTGLNKISFVKTTLAEKTKKIEDDIRKYHLRFGFVCEIQYGVPGQLPTARAVDNDNDGLWTSLYLGSQAFRYAVTGEEEARRYAWESFEAFERLLSINHLKGFPSRTFERKGIIHDTIVWRAAKDPEWDWKGTTSTDEYIGYLFVASVLDQFVAKTPQEKGRVASFIDAIMTHILDNNLYFVDYDGKPTKWGRWNPEYVNAYAPYVSDRKLNSAHLIAGLQLAYALTGKERYKQKAFEMMDQYGYLDNIMIPMKTIQRTTDFVHLKEVMGDEWNHSDDEMSFMTYYVLAKYAFNDTLKKKYQWVAKDHWEIEKPERDALWNVLTCAVSGDVDTTSTLWHLREYCTDLNRYSVHNSHRKDLDRLPDNFRHQTTRQLLLPGEREMHRHNTNPFALDAGGDGQSRLAGDEYLLPYWMARYLKIIVNP
ncbi:MAG: hypothetical protein LWW85_12470 [Marinilabiliales bacterium]|nr:hypothetical protein [Marinilabiliales bacterium]